MFATLLPFLITAGATIGSTLLQNHANRVNLDAMNAYNSPAQQMARYSQAGLNPNLIYGQGNAGNQPSPLVSDVPKLDYYGANEQYHNTRYALYNWQYLRRKIAQVDLENKKLSESEPYFGSNASHQSAILKQNLAKVIMGLDTEKKRQLLLDIDKDIRSNIRTQGNYYNQFRTDYGIERSDSPWLRMGAVLGGRVYHAVNQHLHRK